MLTCDLERGEEGFIMIRKIKMRRSKIKFREDCRTQWQGGIIEKTLFSEYFSHR